MYLNNDVQQWWYFLVSTIAISGTLGTFLLVVGNCYSLHDSHDSLWWYSFSLRSFKDIFFAIHICPWKFWGWCGINDDDQQRWYYLRSSIAVDLIMNILFLALWSWYYLNNNQQLVYYLTSVITLLPVTAYLFPDFRSCMFIEPYS